MKFSLCNLIVIFSLISIVCALSWRLEIVRGIKAFYAWRSRRQPEKDNYNFMSWMYGPVAFFLFSFLFECLLKKLISKKVTRLKLWQYTHYGLCAVVISCLLMFCTYSVAPPKATLTALAGSVLYIFLKQKHGYTKADIDEAQTCKDSIGAFWAHHAYDSYYEVVLQNIRERIKEFEKENDVELLIKKLVLLVPLSCNVRGTLTDLDEKVQLFMQLDPIECDQGANINRKYKNPVYKIIGEEDVYILVETPSSLLTLWQVHHSMQREKWEYHRICFVETLKSLIYHSPCIIIEYDDTVNSPEPLHSFLLSALSAKENTRIQME